MSKRQRTIERAKNAIIVLLLVCTAALLRFSGYYTSIKERIEPADKTGQNAAGTTYDVSLALAQARPAVLAVHGAEGTCFAGAYDREMLEEMFYSFSSALGEALGSASAPEQVDEAAWRRALKGESVFFDYCYAQPLSLLSGWLGTPAGAAGEFSSGRLLLCCEGERVELYFTDAAAGGFYRCSTALTSSALTERTALYRGNNSFFAFESEKLASLDPYTVVLESIPEQYGASSMSTVDNGFNMDKLLSLLGMNSYVMKQYTESDGTRVYVENGKTMRIEPGGVVSCKSGFSVSSDESGGDAAAAVKTAFEFVQAAMGGSCGAAELRFSGLDVYGDGGYLVRFAYSINGIAVEMNGACAAKITVKRGVVTQSELMPRSYTLDAEQTALLPMITAAAAAAASGEAELRLVYSDDGARAECMWVD